MSEQNEIEPIAAQEAREILYNAIQQRLGQDWRDEQSGWVVVTGHDFMARLTDGHQNIEFYVDLLGEVTIEEKEISPTQESGRPLFWAFVIGSLLVALTIARVAGYL